ncbi:GNAT family N-acetyltransferase [Halocynthiibacter styelae]|uniref:GNAT family N-acetyltransferase n=1 Tax=Halocynthiibacter styelae TaxID=2761955 RepID=A0A8J7IDH2_9RHOB|nr:GNAT family N-acetyltransferase [Paenihalocynthiibacter styelae]MBI1492657.1 GNAT family N-acetyltransferase [Paenihalocynthiibacter styelae]
MGFMIDTARPQDAAACAQILCSWGQENPWMPRLWTAAQTEAFVSGLIARGSVSVLRGEGGQLSGFLDLNDGWVNCLYLAPHARGQGQGKMLIAHAARLHPSGLHLWCFADNRAAVRFYTRAGFREVARTDGDNDEGLPDIQLYRPADADDSKAEQ